MKTILRNMTRAAKRMLKGRKAPQVSAVDAIVRLLKESQIEMRKELSSDLEQGRQDQLAKKQIEAQAVITILLPGA